MSAHRPWQETSTRKCMYQSASAEIFNRYRGHPEGRSRDPHWCAAHHPFHLRWYSPPWRTNRPHAKGKTTVGLFHRQVVLLKGPTAILQDRAGWLLTVISRIVDGKDLASSSPHRSCAQLEKDDQPSKPSFTRGSITGSLFSLTVIGALSEKRGSVFNLFAI